MRRKSKLCAIAMVIVLSACGATNLFKGFQVALQSSRPLVSSLVNSGAIDQTRAEAIVTDFNDGAQCGITASEAFKAIPGDLPDNEKKARKFLAAQTALQCFRTVVQRRNFASHPRVQDAANIADGILASIVIFYSSSTFTTAAPSVHVVIAKDEDDLERQLKKKVEALEAALRP